MSSQRYLQVSEDELGNPIYAKNPAAEIRDAKRALALRLVESGITLSPKLVQEIASVVAVLPYACVPAHAHGTKAIKYLSTLSTSTLRASNVLSSFGTNHITGSTTKNGLSIAYQDGETRPALQVIENQASSIPTQAWVVAQCALGNRGYYLQVDRDIYHAKYSAGKVNVPHDSCIDVLGLYGYDTRTKVPSWALSKLVDVVQYRLDADLPMLITFRGKVREFQPRHHAEDHLLGILSEAVTEELWVWRKT